MTSAEAMTLLTARNESVRQPQLNLHIARSYLAASDPEATKRTWAVPLEELAKTKQGVTHDRRLRVLKDDAFTMIRELPLLETRPEHLFRMMEAGTVSTNVFLRRVPNFDLDMGWLPWPVNWSFGLQSRMVGLKHPPVTWIVSPAQSHSPSLPTRRFKSKRPKGPITFFWSQLRGPTLRVPRPVSS